VLGNIQLNLHTESLTLLLRKRLSRRTHRSFRSARYRVLSCC
jgi:hypothetical protein